MSDELDFTGRVAVITGAGLGLGLAYANVLASRGASVVVNDLGTSVGGKGTDTSRSQVAVEAITAAGGKAVADHSDISTEHGAAAVVQCALDSFGRLDIVINNAGIFRLDHFPDIELDSIQMMLGVHVKGSFLVTRAAWPSMVEAGYGRVVFTTSQSALGAPDTTAYGTAKMGVIGLARAVATVGKGHGIRANLVAPLAMTRMMSTGMGQGDTYVDAADRSPRLVAPLVAVLAHETCPVNGELYSAGARRISRFFLAETAGYTHPGLDLTPETILDRWPQINNVTEASIVTDTMDWAKVNEHYLANTIA